MLWVFPALFWRTDSHRIFTSEGEVSTFKEFGFGLDWNAGVIALAAAIALPQNLVRWQSVSTRDLIVFLAFSVILHSWCFRVTLSWVGEFSESGADGPNPEERAARRQMRRRRWAIWLSRVKKMTGVRGGVWKTSMTLPAATGDSSGEGKFGGRCEFEASSRISHIAGICCEWKTDGRSFT